MLMGWVNAVRRNHAIEHATVAVLLARNGPRRIAGRASGDGFFLLSDVSDDEVRVCAAEALARLQRGEASLAVSPLCGTNLAVTGVLAASAATGVLATGALRRRFANAFSAAMFAAIAAQPIGRLVQRHFTTRADVEGVELTGMRTVVGGLRKVYTSGANAR